MADYDFDFGQILHHPTDAQWDEQFEYGVLWASTPMAMSG